MIRRLDIAIDREPRRRRSLPVLLARAAMLGLVAGGLYVWGYLTALAVACR